ncbi:MAG: flagellar biosynthetic protein FliO, partial [Ilumatobacteraceae bacterium]
MIRLLVATLLLAAIAVTVRLKARGTGPTRSIKVSARAAVNRGAVVAIIEAEGRRLLIGAAANQVNILADLGSAATSAAAGESGEIVDVEPAPAAPSWLIT